MLIFYSFDSYPEGSSQKWEFGIKNSFLFFFFKNYWSIPDARV